MRYEEACLNEVVFSKWKDAGFIILLLPHGICHFLSPQKVTKKGFQQEASLRTGPYRTKPGKPGLQPFALLRPFLALASAKIAMPCNRTRPTLFSPLLAEAAC
jgi:hypothetical protein